MMSYYDALLADIPTIMISIVGIGEILSINTQLTLGASAGLTLLLLTHGLFINPPRKTPNSHATPQQLHPNSEHKQIQQNHHQPND